MTTDYGVGFFFVCFCFLLGLQKVMKGEVVKYTNVWGIWKKMLLGKKKNTLPLLFTGRTGLGKVGVGIIQLLIYNK